MFSVDTVCCGAQKGTQRGAAEDVWGRGGGEEVGGIGLGLSA
jgi:hypothetical protein